MSTRAASQEAPQIRRSRKKATANRRLNRFCGDFGFVLATAKDLWKLRNPTNGKLVMVQIQSTHGAQREVGGIPKFLKAISL